MTTIDITEHLAQFTATGLIVVDGDAFECEHEHGRVHTHVCAPELWRKLTDPCPTCGRSGLLRSTADDASAAERVIGGNCPDCVGGRQVVTVTAICTTCDGTYWTPRPVRGHASHCSVCRLNFSRCNCKRQRCTLCITTPGVVTLGRFTIRLLPVVERADVDWSATPMVTVNSKTGVCRRWWDGSGSYEDLALDPLPQPGQWAVQFDPAP